jgi:hypothetical protein
MAGEDGRIPDTVTLCSHHEAVIASLRHMDHIDDRESERAAAAIARQCCNQGRDLR